MIQVAWLCKTNLITKYCFDKVLDVLVNDLKQVENVAITVIIDGKECKFKGSISYVVAENVGSHSIGGFIEGFTVTRFCRFCMCVSSQLSGTPLKYFLESSKESYTVHAEKAEQDSYFVKGYGIKRNSASNNLSFFHVVDSLPYDAMYDRSNMQ